MTSSLHVGFPVQRFKAVVTPYILYFKCKHGNRAVLFPNLGRHNRAEIHPCVLSVFGFVYFLHMCVSTPKGCWREFCHGMSKSCAVTRVKEGRAHTSGRLSTSEITNLFAKHMKEKTKRTPIILRTKFVCDALVVSTSWSATALTPRAVLLWKALFFSSFTIYCGTRQIAF